MVHGGGAHLPPPPPPPPPPHSRSLTDDPYLPRLAVRPKMDRSRQQLPPQYQRMAPPSLNPLEAVPAHPKAPSPMRRGDAIDVFLTPDQMRRSGQVEPVSLARGEGPSPSLSQPIFPPQPIRPSLTRSTFRKYLLNYALPHFYNTPKRYGAVGGLCTCGGE